LDDQIIARLGIFWSKNRKQAVTGVALCELVRGTAHLNIQKESQREKVGDQGRSSITEEG
jgi:hypothetical protein